MTRLLRMPLRSLVLTSILVFTVTLMLVLNQPPDNPPVVAEPVWDSPATRTLAQRACFDCHSNQTRWPLSSRFPLVRGFIVKHVLIGRRRINFSEWQPGMVYDSDLVAGQVFDPNHYRTLDTLPLPSYTSMHPKARLSETERDQLERGLVMTLGGGLME
jgi:hypothetical protein